MNKTLPFIALLLCGGVALRAGPPTGADSTSKAPAGEASSTILNVVIFPGDSIHAVPDSSLDICIGINVTEEERTPVRATAALIHTSRIELFANGSVESTNAPDTVVSSELPLSSYLSPGAYTLEVNKAGFRHETRRLRLTGAGMVDHPIEMYSLQYLDRMHNQWMSRVWIGAGVSVLAGFATLYFNERCNVNMNRYNDAMTVNDAVNYRKRVAGFRTGYTISSAFVISSLTTVLVSWLAAETFR